MSETTETGTAEAQDAEQVTDAQKPAEGSETPNPTESTGEGVEGSQIDAQGSSEASEDQPEDRRKSDADELPEWARTERSNLRKEAAEWRTKFRALEEATKGAKTAQEFEEILSKHNSEVKQLEQQIMARDVCDELNIPAKLRVFVTGDTREEMVEKAKLLTSPFGDPAQSVEPSGGLTPGADTVGDFSDPEKAVRSMRELRNR